MRSLPRRHFPKNLLDWDRRRFLKTTALGAAGASLSCYLRAAKPKPHPCDVIVIGAGMGGISAASRLKADAPQLNVIVLEARGRMGGRINAAFTPGGHKPLELGASFIHNADFNPLTPLAQSYGLTTIDSNFNTRSFREDGSRLGSTAEADAIATIASIAVDLQAMGAQRRSDGLPDIDMQTALDTIIAGQSPPFTAEQQRYVACGVSVLLNLGEGCAPSDVSLKSFGEDLNVVAVKDDLVLPSYASLVQAMGAGLDIRYNHPVSKIAYDTNRVTVTTTNGVFTAAQCVVAMPTQVLKSGSITFDPILPPAKLSALNNMGMAKVGKIYLGFDTTFWDTDAGCLLRVPVSSAANEWVPWANVGTPLGANVVFAFCGGDFAQTVEGMSDEDAVDSAWAAFKNMYGNSIPAPTYFARTFWITDPYSLGAWNHIKPGGTPADYDTIQAPIGHVLYFCGEGTSRNFPRSVNGAYLTGQEAADEILTYRGIFPPP